MSEKKYLIIGSVTEQYFRAAEYIQKKYKIEPVLWAAPSSYTNQIHKDFQDTIFLDYYLFLRGNVKSVNQLIGANVEDITAPLTIEWQELYSSDRLSIIESLLHRTDPGGNYTLSEITETVNNYFIIANAITSKLKPDLIVFSDVPHLPCDLALYYVAKKQGIHISFATNTHIENISFVGDSINAPHNFINLDKDKKYGESEKNEFIAKNLQTIGKEIPFYMLPGKGYLASDTYARSLSTMIYNIIISSLSSFKWYFLKKINTLGIFNFKNNNERYSKVKNKDLWKTSGSSYVIFRHVVLNVFLEIYYNYKAKSFLGGSKGAKNKYVYIPLSMQKERTTMPCAGHMYDQSLYINQIINFLPKGWLVVIKENPKQFRHNTGIPARDLRFYKKLIQSGVVFAPLDYPSSDLISNSAAVCVTTGTAGFESIAGFGKPVLSFADSWYSTLPGIMKIQNTKDIKKAFELLCSDKIILDKESIDSSIRLLMNKSFLLTFAPLSKEKHCEYMSLNFANVWLSILDVNGTKGGVN